MMSRDEQQDRPAIAAAAVAQPPRVARRSALRPAAGADSADVYSFVSPARPSTVTLIANYIPLQEPAGGPNFYEFGEDVRHEIHIDNDGDGLADVSYQFDFQTVLRDPGTFLYNTGPIRSLDSRNWNSRQFYTVRKVTGGGTEELAS